LFLWFILLVWENKFPDYDERVLKKRNVVVVVQINGKVRDKIEISPDTDENKIQKMVFESEKVRKFIEGKNIVKKFYIKNKIYSIVVR